MADPSMWAFDGVVATQHIETAEELLAALDPALSEELARHVPVEYWVCRGQASAEWPLVPSAFRHTAKGWTAKGWKNLGPLAARTTLHQIKAEIDTICRFFSLADRHGFAIPEDCRALRHYVDRLRHSDDIKEYEAKASQWPNDLILPLLGLAQHYMIPTRLLDWTYDAQTAAYFAARSACERAEKGELDTHLCIWIFFKYFTEMGIGSPLIEMVTVPTATNRNLHAQKGLFVVMRSGTDDLSAPADLRSLEERFKDLVPEMQRRFPKSKAFQDMFGGAPVFLKYTLPTHQAGMLLKLLAARGVTAATIFPGLDGVANAMRDEAYWLST